MADNWSPDQEPISRASDEIGGVEYPRTKISIGPDGTAVDLSRAEPMPILDPWLEMAMDIVTGISHVNKFGMNPAIASATTEEVWDGSATYVYPATALMTSMSQTADQVAMRGATIEWQGLDANWDPVTQTKALDASDTTTVVALTTPMIRVFRGLVQANVVGDQDIRCHNAGETQDYAVILAGNNQTEMALYTVPDGFTAYLTSFYGDAVITAAQNPKNVEFKLWAADRLNSYEFQLKHSRAVSDTVTGFEHDFRPYKVFTERSDIKITARPEDKAVVVHAGFDIILVAN